MSGDAVLTRRRFLSVMGAAVAVPLGGACASERGDAANGGGRSGGRAIGLQLYTVRDEMERDFEGTLAQVAEIGYREVEFAGYFGRTPAQVRRALDAAGLRAPSAHVDISVLDETWDRTLEAARVVGHDYLVVPSIPAASRTLDGYRRVALRFDRAGEAALRAGVRFAYHNHDFEFAPVDGLLPYDVLLQETNPRHVYFELDLYWITRAGADPRSYFRRWPGRFHLVHMKDMDATAERGMTEVGEGTIDFGAIVGEARDAGIRHWFVEHDRPAQPLESIRKSYEGMRSLLGG